MPVTVTTFVTVPPNFFDIHYWMFGMFVMFAITALIDGALVLETDVPVLSDTFILASFIGMFVGSVIALMMNTIPWIVSPIVFLAMVLYIWRGRTG